MRVRARHGVILDEWHAKLHPTHPPRAARAPRAGRTTQVTRGSLASVAVTGLSLPVTRGP